MAVAHWLFAVFLLVPLLEAATPSLPRKMTEIGILLKLVLLELLMLAST